jgi:hypothetical protein
MFSAAIQSLRKPLIRIDLGAAEMINGIDREGGLAVVGYRDEFSCHE